jgi:dTDP-4-amino-4,6-dideoxygalactose transaminase
MAALTEFEPVVTLRDEVRHRPVPLSAPAFDDSDIAGVVDALRAGDLGSGAQTAAFERVFAEYVGVPEAVAVSSGSAALHLTMAAAGIGPGDDVVVPAMTFVATANAVLHTGATPLLCDVDLATGILRVEDIARVRTRRTRAVVPVHFAGRAADLTAIETYAREHGLLLISDASHAIEATHRGRSVAHYGLASIYSFNAAKNITTGEGGMVVTGDPALAARVRSLRRHGLETVASAGGSSLAHREMVEFGYQYALSDLQAALGVRQLARIEQMNRSRRTVWRKYNEALAGLPLRRPAPVTLGDRHALHLYTVLLNLESLDATRDEIAAALGQEGIATGVHYRGVHLQPFYQEHLGYAAWDFPNATSIADRTLSLPLSASMTEGDVEEVALALGSVLRRFRR